MVLDVNWMYCGDQFAVYSNTKSLHGISETNITLCQLYLRGEKANKENYPRFRTSPHSKMGTPGMRLQQQFTVKTNPLSLYPYGKEGRKM